MPRTGAIASSPLPPPPGSRTIQTFPRIGLPGALSVPRVPTIEMQSLGRRSRSIPGVVIPPGVQDRISEFQRIFANTTPNISSEENVNLIRHAEVTSSRSLYVSFEMGPLKDLNDRVFQSKDLSNAARNLFWDLLMEEFNADLELGTYRSGGGLLDGRYLDYKILFHLYEVRSGEDYGQAILARIEQAYLRTAARFREELTNWGIVDAFRLSERGAMVANPSVWFLAGAGPNPDLAWALGRIGKEVIAEGERAGKTPELLPLFHWWDESNQQRLRLRLNRIELKRVTLVSALQSLAAKKWGEHSVFTAGGMLQPASYADNGVRVQGLSRELAEILRTVRMNAAALKINSFESYAAEIAQRVRETFSVDLNLNAREDLALIRELRDYYTDVDSFIVGAWIDKRVQLNLATANRGIMSVDFAGLGADNAFEAMQALAREYGAGVESAIKGVRHGFDIATKSMSDMQRYLGIAIDEAFQNGESQRIQFSADDGIYLPEKNFLDRPLLKTQFLRLLSQHPMRARFRVTFLDTVIRIGSQQMAVPPKFRSRLLVNAENLEKSIRKSLRSKGMGSDLLNRLMIIPTQRVLGGRQTENEIGSVEWSFQILGAPSELRIHSQSIDSVVRSLLPSGDTLLRIDLIEVEEIESCEGALSG